MSFENSTVIQIYYDCLMLLHSKCKKLPKKTWTYILKYLHCLTSSGVFLDLPVHLFRLSQGKITYLGPTVNLYHPPWQYNITLSGCFLLNQGPVNIWGKQVIWIETMVNYVGNPKWPRPLCKNSPLPYDLISEIRRQYMGDR